MLKSTGTNQNNNPSVVILLATYNGQNYLEDQLKSFEAQTHPNWTLLSSDDGSSDETLSILKRYQSKWTNTHDMLLLGPQKGFAANFLSLVCKANINSDFYAYADQDDIWEPKKLETAIDFLKTIAPEIPALYCSRTKIVDRNNNQQGLSPLFNKTPDFANALVQNIGSGNTMVFNKAARDLLKIAGKETVVISHDWWTYMLVSGCGGKVFYDPVPKVRYRQHNQNLVGCNTTFKAMLERISMVTLGRYKQWNSTNIAALYEHYIMLIPPNKKTLDNFTKSRKGNFISRLWYLRKSGVYRQSFIGNLGLIVAVIFNRI
ncbi:MAG TPA: glycosyltransferase family 2 protein [Methylotenera sp.]